VSRYPGIPGIGERCFPRVRLSKETECPKFR